MKKISIIAGCFIILTSCYQPDRKMRKAQYSGKDISSLAEITRDPVTKKAELNIQNVGSWKLYGSTNVDTMYFDKPLIHGENEGTFQINIPDTMRYYFELDTDEGNTILAERHLPMQGGFNFRDIGGYKTQDGKYVKWGKLFRSDELKDLKESDLKYLSNIPIITLVDFRSKTEIDNNPDKVPASVLNTNILSIEPGNISDVSLLTTINEEQADSLMSDINVMFVTDSVILEQYKKFFELLQDDKNIPLMYHCTAGKDRTGMATALILYSLGVDDETIMKDYLLSNQYLQKKYENYKKEFPNITPFFEVREHYLQAGLDEIKKQYGSIDNFLTNKLFVDTKKMRNLYLY